MSEEERVAGSCWHQYVEVWGQKCPSKDEMAKWGFLPPCPGQFASWEGQGESLNRRWCLFSAATRVLYGTEVREERLIRAAPQLTVAASW